MPEFWEYPTVSMGLGPLNSIYHARYLRYLHNRRIDDTAGTRVWCFIGDGEIDEPETLGALTLPARDQLDNLTWVINCNLQRLDGPVRGNGKVIQELEAVFRGAGWNVIKVVWGSKWDELLVRDKDGVLLDRMNRTVDGEFQRYAVESGAYTREHFFGPDTRLRKMVEHLSDDEIRNLPRGGHDYRKLYAAYKAATEHRGAPTVILAKTIKGWTLGPDVEGRNATHQIKKMTVDQLRVLRERLYLQDVIDEDALADDKEPPYIHFVDGSVEQRYMLDRRKALDGLLPSRSTQVRRPLAMPEDKPFEEVLAGSGKQEVSTTMAFTRLLRNLHRDPNVGSRVVPIIPDEARTFGMDALFKEFRIYAAHGQAYEPVDAQLLLSYSEGRDGQVLEEGITEAGSMASFIAAATSYAHRGVPMLPFFTFYSMFGFQRVGDLIWSAADSRARGFLLGATAGRTTLLGEGLQHQDGHSLVLASTVPTVEAWDPAFAYEMATIVKQGIHDMLVDERDVVYYLTLYNENYLMPPRPDGAEEGILQGLYRWADGARGPAPPGLDPVLGHGPGGGARRPGRAGRAVGRQRRAVVGHQLQAPPRGGAVGRALEPPPPDRGTEDAARHAAAVGRGRPAGRGGGHRLHEVGARPGRALGAPHVRAARHRRLRPVRHPRTPARVLRGRHAARRGDHPVGPGPAGRGQGRDGGRGDRPLRDRPRAHRTARLRPLTLLD